LKEHLIFYGLNVFDQVRWRQSISSDFWSHLS